MSAGSRLADDPFGPKGQPLRSPRGVLGQPDRKTPLYGQELGHQPRRRPVPVAVLQDRLQASDRPVEALFAWASVGPAPRRQIDNPGHPHEGSPPV